MANIKISQLPSLATLADTTVFSTVNSGVNYKSSALSIKNYITWPVTNTTGSNGPTNIAIGQNAGATGIGNVAIGVGAAGTGNNIITIGTNAGQGYTGNGSILIGPTGSVSANSLIVFNATGSTLTPVSAQNNSFYVAPIRNNAGTSGVLQYNSTTKEVTYGNAITIGDKTWNFGTDGTTTFPGGYLKVVPNGANPYIGNNTFADLGGGDSQSTVSAISINQSVADNAGINIDTSVTNSLSGGTYLAAGSSMNVNGTRIVLGPYTVNSLGGGGPNLFTQNKIEINNNATLIGQYVSNTTDGNTITAFTGWTFTGNTRELTLPLGGVIADGSSGTGVGHSIILKPQGGSATQALKIYPTGAGDGDHVHLTAGGGATELYLGNDFQYVKLVNGGNIQVQASTANFSAHADWTFGTDGELSLPTNSYTEAVIKELSATALVLFAQSTGGNIKLLAGTTSAGSAKQWLFNGTDGTLSSKMFLASAGSYGTTGYSFTGDGGLDTGMFSAGDGQIQFYSNTVKVAEIASGNLTISGHPTIEGVTTTGATGTGKLVFDNAPTFSGHITVEGVTATGATGTGKLVFDNAPTFSGTVTTSTLTVKDVRDTVYAATFASTFTPDAANGAIQNVTLTGGITINAFANPVAGQTVTLILTQGGSGSYALTSTMKFAGGLKTLSTAVGSVDLLTITYTGSVYYASLVTGFV